MSQGNSDTVSQLTNNDVISRSCMFLPQAQANCLVCVGRVWLHARHCAQVERFWEKS